MDINRLRYFITVVDTGSLRKASEILHISPAALSKAIKTLEDELNCDLIYPVGRGIQITKRGQELATEGRSILQNVEKLELKMRGELAGEYESKEPLRIGSFEVFTTLFLKRFVDSFQQVDNTRPLTLREVGPGQLENAILNDEIDYGLTYVPIPSSGIEHLSVATITMGLFGSRDFVRSIKGIEFKEIPFVIPVQPVQGSPTKVQGLDGWPDDRIARKVKYRVELMGSALEIARRGMAAAYLPKFIGKLHNELVKPKFELIEFAAPKTRGINLSTHQQKVFLVRKKNAGKDTIFSKLGKHLKKELEN